jgi:hypothetical protein
MRLIKLDRYEYQIIGEIAVISGMIEQQMKELIVKFVRAPWPGGLALAAHLNFSALCDTALALLPSTVPDTSAEGYSLRGSFETMIKGARSAYEDRNRIMHGPFSPWPALAGSPKTTLKLTARGKIAYQAFQFNREELKKILATFIDAYEGLFGCVALLEAARTNRLRGLVRPAPKPDRSLFHCDSSALGRRGLRGAIFRACEASVPSIISANQRLVEKYFAREYFFTRVRTAINMIVSDGGANLPIGRVCAHPSRPASASPGRRALTKFLRKYLADSSINPGIDGASVV